MITIIYGEDIAASRKYYIAQKTAHPNPSSFQGTSLTLADITQALAGGGLFGDEITICIEEFFSRRKASKDMDAIIRFLAENENQANIIFWESKDLTAKQTGYFKKATVKQFKITKTIFTFLDSLRPGNHQTMIKLFHQTLSTEDEQFIFTMLVRQIRLLLAVSDDSSDTIDEVKKMQSWMKGKLKKQASLFSLDSLKQAHHNLFLIDKFQKTGQLPYSLSQAVDIWLLGL